MKKENCSNCGNNTFWIHDNNIVCTKCRTVKIFSLRKTLKLKYSLKDFDIE